MVHLPHGTCATRVQAQNQRAVFAGVDSDFLGSGDHDCVCSASCTWLSGHADELGESPPCADTRVVLFRFDQGPQPGGTMNVTFWTDDVEGTARDLQGKGVEFVTEPTKAPWGTFAIFKDQDDNRFVLGTK